MLEETQRHNNIHGSSKPGLHPWSEFERDMTNTLFSTTQVVH